MTTDTKSVSASVEPVARINVTPIIDVALVLVIILLITAPMLSVTDASLDLPPSSAQAGASETRIFVTLGQDGRLGVDDQVVARAGLEAALAERIGELSGENPLVVIRADLSATHGSVRDLLDAARAAGARRIAVATRPGDYR